MGWYVAALLITAAVLFFPAGTMFYWQAWVYLAIFFVPMIFALRYMLKYEPELLERRMRIKEKEPGQKTLSKLGYLLFFVLFVIPGLDKRYGWSSVPWYIIVISEVIIFIGYIFVIRVLKENRYASRNIEVEQGQQVITTGPYAYIRHPMYAGVSVMYFITPLALGSYWGLISGAMIIVFLIARILNEEKVLLQELKGYQEYIQKTKYRLIPGIW